MRTFSWALILSILWILSPAFAAKKGSSEWRAALKGEAMDDRLAEAKLVGLDANTRIFHPFSPILSTNLEIGFRIQTGSVQNLFTDEFRPKQSLLLSEARINWDPFEFFTLNVGAINQSHFGSPIFIDNHSFPALQEKFHFGLGSGNLELSAQQAIPTSRSFSTRAIGKESTPFLSSASVKWLYEDPAAWEFSVRGTYFQFKNLTRGIAQDSRFYGNTVIGLGPEGAQFLNKYEGFEAGADISFKLNSKWQLFAGNSFLQNSKAVASSKRGTYFFGGFTYNGSRMSVTPSFWAFNVESDSSPAFYTNKAFSHNNRKGLKAKISVHLNPEKLTIDAEYVNSSTIKASPTQSDRKYVQLKLTMDYMSF